MASQALKRSSEVVATVENIVASFDMESMHITSDEAEVLEQIVAGEVDGSEVVRETIRKFDRSKV